MDTELLNGHFLGRRDHGAFQVLKDLQSSLKSLPTTIPTRLSLTPVQNLVQHNSILQTRKLAIRLPKHPKTFPSPCLVMMMMVATA